MVARNAFGDLATEETLALIRARAAQLASEATAASMLALWSDMQSPSGAMVTSSTHSRFRDSFSQPTTQPDASVWTLVNDAPDTGNGQGHIVRQGGDSFGSSYLHLSLSPFLGGSGVYLTSKQAFRAPMKVGYGISVSQRIVGQEVFFGIAQQDVADAQGIKRTAQPADLPIVGTVTTASNVGTLTVTGHGLKGGDRVLLIGNTEKRLNVGPVVVTVIDANTITVPITTIGNGTYTAGGVVRWADPVGLARNGIGLLHENATVTNASFTTRRNGGKFRSANQTVVTSVPVQGSTASYTDAWLAAGVNELYLTMDEVSYRSFGADSNNAPTGLAKYQQAIPDEDEDYCLHLRARNLDVWSRPIAKVTNITKTASTTVTVTTAAAHGLVVGDTVSITGVRDQTNFAPGSSTVVTVPSATTFTGSLGISATASDALGGTVWLNHGSVNTPGLLSGAVQSIASTVPGVLNVVGSASWAGINSGDFVNLHGLLGAGAAVYEGAYKVLRLSTTNLELAYTGATFGSITTGGSAIRRTDVRVHFARVLDHTRNLVEVLGGRANTSDQNNAVPVIVTGAATVNVNALPQPGVVEGVTTTNLGVSASYSQTAIDTSSTVASRQTRVRIGVMHTAGTVHGYLILEQSQDNTTFRETHKIPIPSDGVHHTFEFPVAFRYYRMKFTNGITAQTAFFLGWLMLRGEADADLTKNLQFPLTPAAGVAATGSATTSWATLDLGPNHQWNTVRLWCYADVAGTFFIDESFDGATWRTIGAGTAVTAGGAARVEQQIATRYVRVRHVNGAGAATAVTAIASLVSL